MEQKFFNVSQSCLKSETDELFSMKDFETSMIPSRTINASRRRLIPGNSSAGLNRLAVRN